MAKKETTRIRGMNDSQSIAAGCCKIDALVSIDGRGQLVLPKGLREKANIKAGDKLAVISWERGDEVCCITLVKANDFAGPVKTMLGPIMKEILE